MIIEYIVFFWKTGLQFIQHPQKNGILQPNNNKYTFNTSRPTLLVLDEQISFKNVTSFTLKDVEVGVVTDRY
jgi:hypothetical protein